jgi:alpha-D-ribose 1-methylphosphonate 5-triphosphate synthase subunit PhnL
MMGPMLKIEGLKKQFTLHQQGGVQISVFDNLNLEINAGEAVALTGASGRGKSSLLKLIYGTYRANAGSVSVRHDDSWSDVTTATPLEMIEIRRNTIGYVTQFLRVIPRVPAELVVAEPLMDRGVDQKIAVAQARGLLQRLNIPERLWHLSPMTFSGGEQQRVNIARGFAARFPLLLIDEPTASLDSDNRERVLQLIDEACQSGVAVVGVFHDEEERKRACSREIALG